MPASRPPLCQPVQGRSFELSCLASVTCLYRSCPPPTPLFHSYFRFRKALAVKINWKQKLDMLNGFTLIRFLEGCGCEGHREKQIKGCMVLLSCRRWLLQGFGCEEQPTKRIKTPHAFLALLLCRCLKGSGCEDQLTKKLQRHIVFLVFSGPMVPWRYRVLEGPGCKKQFTKKVKTPPGFLPFLLYLIQV